MASRPRRSAAVKAHEAISDWADRDLHNGMSTRTRRSDGRPSGASVTRDPPSSPGDTEHLNLTVKVPSAKLREATSGGGRNAGVAGREGFVGGEIMTGKRNRGAQKSYVINSDESDMSEPDDEDEEMEDAAGEDDDVEVDADGDDDDDDDAEGEEDADGDIDMDATPVRPHTIKLQNPKAAAPKPPVRRPAAARVVGQDEDEEDDDDDDDELSELEDLSEPEASQEKSIMVGGATADEEEEDEEEEDAEGEEEDAEGEDDDMEPAEGDVTGQVGGEIDSDEEAGTQDDTLDLTKMTRRQRARFEEVPQDYMKLSDEVQVKKVFTAEELSMRRAEMARRRRNLSEKRTEEVKMETINKLLKKQAPKTNKKGQTGGGDTPSEDIQRPEATMVRWVSTKEGIRVAIPSEIAVGPAGKVFGGPGLRSGKMVEEVK